MTLSDLLRMALHNLWIRKLRTALNLVGIVVASVLLLATLAATQGIKQAVVRFVESSEHSRKFRVYPDYDRTVQPPEEEIKVVGTMSDRRRTRIRKLLENYWREKNQPRRYQIPKATIEKLRGLDHIVEVAPGFSAGCDIKIGSSSQKTVARSCSSLNTSLRDRVIAGEFISDTSLNSILIHEGLAYRLGFRSDSELEELIGQDVTLKFRSRANSFSFTGEDFYSQSIEEQTRWFQILDDLISGKSLDSLDSSSKQKVLEFLENRSKKKKKVQLIQKSFRICGIFRRNDEQDIQNVLERYTGGYGDILIQYRVFETELAQVIRGDGANNANIYIDDFNHLNSAIAECKKYSVGAVTPTDIIERIIDAVEKSKFTLGGIVLIVLFISAIGISNTMFISLIERTEEIGIMKAIGAGNRDVLKLILLEGFLTGIIGGIVSIAIALLVTAIGNGILRNYVENRASLQLEGAVFDISAWMVLLTIALAVVTTSVAGIWPAWRASRIDPVVAMGQR